MLQVWGFEREKLSYLSQDRNEIVVFFHVGFDVGGGIVSGGNGGIVSGDGSTGGTGGHSTGVNGGGDVHYIVHTYAFSCFPFHTYESISGVKQCIVAFQECVCGGEG